MDAKTWAGLAKLLAVFHDRIVPILVLSLFCYAIWWLIERARGRLSAHPPEVRAAALGFSFVGVAIGIMVGGSREPIAQAGVSAFLGIITAFAAYAFAKDSLDKFRPYAVPIIMTLSMTLVFGLYYGAALREDREVVEKGAEQGRAMSMAVSMARTEICKQAAIKAIEKGSDPIEALPRTCRGELGFVRLVIKN